MSARPTSGRNLARFKPYPVYKDSGVEWLGEIPAHWRMTKMWDVAQATSGGTPAKETLRYWDGDIPWVSPKDMKRRFIDSSEDTVSVAAVSETGLKLVPNPAVLVVVRGMILAHSFPVGITKVPVTINQDMKALRLRDDVDPEFFGHWLEGVGPDLLPVLVDEAAHGTKAIRMDRWRVTPVQIPPEDEQRAIVEFLDRETAKIDALVAKKERVIELLQEKRTALITRAVSKGLDPDVPMKDSGLEWLGKIPAHWDVLPAGRLIDKIEQGWSPVAEDRAAGPEEWGVIKLSAVKKGYFVADEHKALPADVTPDFRFRINDGDFLLTRANTPELVGDVCVVRGARGNLMLCDLVYRLRLRHRLIASSFLAYWLLSRAGRYQIEVDARGSSQSMVKISQGHIFAWPVVVPPYEEQISIAADLDAATTSLDGVLTRIGEGIDRLREFRTALISAVVTGKIDVRDEIV